MAAPVAPPRTPFRNARTVVNTTGCDRRPVVMVMASRGSRRVAVDGGAAIVVLWRRC